MPFRFGKTASVPRWSGAFPARPFTGVHLRYAGVNGPFPGYYFQTAPDGLF